MELATPRPPRQWTPEEIALLRERYPSMTAQQVMPMLPGRSARSIRNKAWELEIGKEIHSPKFWRPIGSERMNRGHLIRKVTDTGQPKKDWKRVEVIEWEALHGPIPQGKCLMVKNPALPRTLDNLAPFSQLEHWARVTAQNLPPEVQQLVQLKGQITQAINRRLKAQEKAR